MDDSSQRAAEENAAAAAARGEAQVAADAEGAAAAEAGAAEEAPAATELTLDGILAKPEGEELTEDEKAFLVAHRDELSAELDAHYVEVGVLEARG